MLYSDFTEDYGFDIRVELIEWQEVRQCSSQQAIDTLDGLLRCRDLFFRLSANDVIVALTLRGNEKSRSKNVRQCFVELILYFKTKRT